MLRLHTRIGPKKPDVGIATFIHRTGAEGGVLVHAVAQIERSKAALLLW